MKKIYVKIEGIHCSHCENKIKKTLLDIENIKQVDFDGNIATISYLEKIDIKKIIKKINELDCITKEEYISEDIKKLKNNIKLKEFIIIILIIILIIFLINKIFGYNIFNVIPTINSNITYGMLFIIGLLTSIHCISMCGAINLVANINKKNKISSPIFYNLGRVISYTLIGGIVGLIGSTFQINNTISGIIILIAATIMLLLSLNMLGIIKIKKIKLFKHKITTRNPFIIGLLNGLMPCGPLQAMQIYALSTGSFIKGALSMFIFSLGTVPLMLTTGLILNVVKGKVKITINKVASTLIFVLSIIMFNRGLIYLNIDVTNIFNNYSNFTTSTLEKNYQVVEFDLTYNNYQDIILQKDVPTKIIINVDKKYLTGCNNEIIINEFGISKKLEIGKNIIEFTPTETGTFTYSCWMNMITNTIKVIDNKNYFKGE